MNELTTKTIETSQNINFSLISFFISTDLVGKLVFIILLCFSVLSWGVIISKFVEIKKLDRMMERFNVTFWSGQVLDNLYEKLKHTHDLDPLTSIFIGGMSECKKGREKSVASSPSVKSGLKERMFQAMFFSRDNEISKVEKMISVLATIGSTAPFIGLFGTVWGIMHSFESIASSKNTSLAVVAPGIAEALLVTAVGLFVAIPALIAYNYLSSRVDDMLRKSDAFINEFGRLLSRAVDNDKM